MWLFFCTCFLCNRAKDEFLIKLNFGAKRVCFGNVIIRYSGKDALQNVEISWS